MSERKIINMEHSVRDRLLKLSHESGRDFNYILQRYAYERFYFRLGKSSHAARFVLKGASLFAVWLGPMFRVTQDTDFESSLTPNHDGMKTVFTEIIETVVPEDGIIFDKASVIVEDIKKEDKYQGLRLLITAYLGRARIRLKFDIGFGDSVYPAPAYCDYPPLLCESDAPRVKIYPQYTVIAEKVSAIVDLGMRNSRLKDYFDMWVLLGKFSLNGALFRTAILRTFGRRGLQLPREWPIGLTETFATDAIKVSQWTAFLRKIEPEERPDSLFSAVARLRTFLNPFFQSADDDIDQCVWIPTEGWSRNQKEVR